MNNKAEKVLIKLYDKLTAYDDIYQLRVNRGDETSRDEDIENQVYLNVIEWLSCDVEFGSKTTLNIKEKEE